MKPIIINLNPGNPYTTPIQLPNIVVYNPKDIRTLNNLRDQILNPTQRHILLHIQQFISQQPTLWV